MRRSRRRGPAHPTSSCWTSCCPVSTVSRSVADDLRVDVKAHQVTLGDRPVLLTPKEFLLLETLVRNRGQVLSPSQLLELVWGYLDTDTRTVAVHIRGLRAKIETDPSSPERI